MEKAVPAMSYSVVVPTLNEVDNVDALVARLLTLPGFAEAGEVIFVDDGSTDGTIERVRQWGGRAPVRLVQRSGTPDLTRAVCEGAAAATNETIVVMDADLSHPPEQIPALLAPLAAGTHDIVIGSRHLASGAAIGWPLHRRALSRLAGALAWPICDLSDPTSGFFAARRALFQRVSPNAAGYKIALELVAATSGTARIAEIPITFRDRVAGRSKLSLRANLLYVARLATLAGSRLSPAGVARCLGAGLVGVLFDGAVLWLTLRSGASLAVAQIAGFAGAIVAALLLGAGQLPVRSPWGLAARRGDLLRFLILAPLAFALRDVILAWAPADMGAPSGLVIAAAILATAVVIGLGSILYVQVSPSGAGRRETRWRVMAIGLTAYLVVLRLAYFGLPQLSGNEAYYWAYAVHPSLSYLDHPPMVAWLIWIGTHLAGHSELGVRLAAPICWLVATAFLCRLAQDLLGKAAAIRTVLLMTAMPYFYLIGVSMTPDTALVACWAAALFFLARLLVFGERRACVGLGLAFGLGLLSKYSIVLLALAALAFLVTDAKARRWLRRPEPYYALVLATLLFVPVLVWNAEHGWASFLFQSMRRLNNEGHLSGTVGAWGLLAALATPTAIVAIALSFLRSGPPAAEAAGGAPDFARRGRLFLRMTLLLPLGAFLVLGLHSPIKSYWMGPTLLAGLPLATEVMRAPALREWRAARLLDRAWVPTVLVLAFVFGFGLPFAKVGAHFDHAGPGATDWRALAASVERVEEQVRKATGSAPITVAMDSHAMVSELSFYDAEDGFSDITNQQLFGRRGLMYAYWLSASEVRGRPVILISDRPADMQGNGIEQMLGDPDRIRRIPEQSFGSSRTFYYRSARSFTGRNITSASGSN